MAASPRRKAAAPTVGSKGKVNAGASPGGRAALAASGGGSAGEVGIGGAATGGGAWPAPALAAGGTRLAVCERAASAAGCGTTACVGERGNRFTAGDGGGAEEAARGAPAWGPPGSAASGEADDGRAGGGDPEAPGGGAPDGAAAAGARPDRDEAANGVGFAGAAGRGTAIADATAGGFTGGGLSAWDPVKATGSA